MAALKDVLACLSAVQGQYKRRFSEVLVSARSERALRLRRAFDIARRLPADQPPPAELFTCLATLPEDWPASLDSFVERFRACARQLTPSKRRSRAATSTEGLLRHLVIHWNGNKSAPVRRCAKELDELLNEIFGTR